MNVVVDTNILFSFFKKDSVTKRLLENCPFTLVSPKFALTELEKYSELIIKKAKTNEENFKSELKKLKSLINFINSKEYKQFVLKIKDSCPDKKDIDFLALTLKEKSFLWSNDSLLKKQDKIKVYSTKEVIDLVF